MALFPQNFVDDLKAQTNIVSIIEAVTPLRKAGGTYKGLCPFHQEKTPSFNVNPDKGFFKCFGCGVGGDVVKFVELHEKVSFPEAVRQLALRIGMTLPEDDGGTEGRAARAERDEIIKLHERALAFFQEQLATPAGVRARRELEARGLTEATVATFRYGYAPAGGRATLQQLFSSEKVPTALQLKSGLVVQREEGRFVDRFRNRLMIPIARDTGAIVAFGGRAMEEGQGPKYLNSSETPIYTKGRVLYGLDVAKAAIRSSGYCVLVEGYFDLAQVWQSGVQAVAALSGTAMTPAQVQLLKRFTTKAVLSLDPDGPGRAAAAKSSELLVAEGFQVNVALLPTGADPDTFIRRTGAAAYRSLLTSSQPYLEYVLNRAATGVDFGRPEARKGFLDEMLRRAAGIPDAAARDAFADRIAHKARITESVIRDEIRKAAAQRRVEAPKVAVSLDTRVRPDEEGLLWTLVHRPVEGLAAMARLGPDDLEGLLIAPIVRMTVGLGEVPPDVLASLVRERVGETERLWIDRAAGADAPAAPAMDCVAAIQRRRVKREVAEMQAEIDRLQSQSAIDDETLTALWRRKKGLLAQLDDEDEGRGAGGTH